MPRLGILLQLPNQVSEILTAMQAMAPRDSLGIF